MVDSNLILYENCKNIAIDAGLLIENSKNTKFKIIRKSKRELVTEIDLQVQRLISERLKFVCDYPIYFEEDKTDGLTNPPAEYLVVDPIDATHNYIAGLPFYNVSIGFVQNGNIIFGIIYFPNLNEIYHAFKNKGAFKGDKKITVSINTSLEKAIIAYDNQFHLSESIIKNFQKLVVKAFTTRILGSASQDACFVAEGVLDARVWNLTKVFDIIAGAIIVEEAGGVVSDFNGEPINFLSAEKVIMSSYGVQEELLDLLDD